MAVSKEKTLKEKALNELQTKIHDVESFIAKNGLGSSYLSRAEKIQRNINVGLFIGGVAFIGGLVAYTLLKSHDEEE